MLKIISGSRCEDLTNKIWGEVEWDQDLGILVDRKLDTFADGEINVEILDNIRGDDVFVVQSLSDPVNDNLIELCLILDSIKRSSVKSVTAIVPYLGYSRQDKKVKSRVPISAKFVADVIQIAGIDRLLTVDLHSSQIQGFYNCPVDNLYGLNESSILDMKNTVLTSPDKGGVERASHYARKINSGLAFCYKHRDVPNEIGEMRLIGCVENKKCILVDDMIDTAGTLCKASEILKERGATEIIACATHGLFSNDAIEKIDKSPIDRIEITNSIPQKKEVLEHKKVRVVDLSPLLAKAILKIYKNESVSSLF